MARARKVGETKASRHSRQEGAAPPADARAAETGSCPTGEPEEGDDLDDDALVALVMSAGDAGAAHRVPPAADAARLVETVVTGADAGGRLDQALAAASGLSRARVQALVKAGRAGIDGRTVIEGSARLAAGARISLDIPAPADATPVAEDIPLTVVYEDAELIVIDKPAGLVVHPAPGNATGTLVNALLHHCRGALSGIGGVRRPGIVHRLDKETSGVLVVAKTNRAHQSLAAQFADHGRTGALERRYLALVWGVPPALAGTIDAPLARDPRNPMRRAVGRGAAAKHAVTHWRLLERFSGVDGEPLASLVECRLETGRTHQVRVHLTHLGHPLIGDPDYGTGFRTKASRLGEPARSLVSALSRQALHAATLVITHPVSGAVMRFDSPLPADLDAIAAALRKAPERH